jgi:predicted secreted protein
LVQVAKVLMKRNLLTRRLGSLLILRQNTEEATEDDWRELLGFFSKNKDELPSIRILVRTDGGTPTASQRRRLAEALGDTHMLVAAVSDSMKVRFAGSTIALFQRNYRQFSTKEIAQAYEHLKMTAAEQRAAEAAMRELELLLYPERRHGLER